jgi:hypothetical protein
MSLWENAAEGLIEESRQDLKAKVAQLEQELAVAHQTIGFFSSVIKSGEPWTQQCQAAQDAAFRRKEE